MSYLKYFIPALLFLLASCSHDVTEIDPIGASDGRRTVLVYMNAQNSLGTGRFHFADSVEMMKGRHHISDEDRLLLFIDDGRENPRLYRIHPNRSHPQLLHRWKSSICASDPRFLTDLLAWTKDYYPASEYGLVMWSHATGWVPSINTNYPPFTPFGVSTYSFGIDNGNRDSQGNGTEMDIDALADAIRQAGIHLRYLFFDACLMQGLETAYALQRDADYLIAAPVATPGAGANYEEQLQSGFFSSDPADIARTYLHSVCDPNQQNLYSDFGLCISVLRLDRIEAVADAVRHALPVSGIEAGKIADLYTAAIPWYQSYSRHYYYRPHQYDALHAFHHLLAPQDYEKVKSALDAATIFKGATPRIWVGPSERTFINVDTSDSRFSGVSTFIPQPVYTENAHECIYGDLNLCFQKTGWYKAAGWNQTGW